MIKHCFNKITFVILFTTLCSATGFTNDPVALLRESMESLESISYRGIITYTRHLPDEQWATTLEVIRDKSGNKKITVLSPDFLKGTILLQNQKGIWLSHLDKEKQETIQSGRDTSLWSWLFKDERHSIGIVDTEVLKKNYRIEIQNTDSFANRPTVCIAISPNRKYRPYLNIYIDKETHMQLKYEKFNWKKELMESFHFDEIDYQVNPTQEDFSTQDMNLRFHNPPEPKEKDMLSELDFKSLKFKWMPAGYENIKEEKFRFIHGPTLYTLYSDGISRLSFYQRRMNEDEIKKDWEERKKNNSDAPRVETIDIKGRSVYVRKVPPQIIFCVGDLPAEVISRILASAELN